MLGILERRKATEEAAETPTLNRLGARTLSNLMDERKSAQTMADVEALCKEYGVSVEVSSLCLGSSEELIRARDRP